MTEFEILFEATKDFIFFCDKDNQDSVFAEFEDSSGVKQVLSVRSKKFQRVMQYLTSEVDDNGKGLSGKHATELIYSWFAFHGNPETVEIHNRVCGNLKSGLEYNLGNGTGQSVLINEHGWEIVDQQHKFVSTSLSLPQVTPQKSNKSLIDLLRHFVNMIHENYILFLVWLVQSFCKGSHFAIMLNAERGSGKSTLSRIIKKILDPSRIEICDKPGKIEDLAVYLSNSHIVCLDNVGSFSKQESDLLCGAITGTCSVKRSLFTDSDLAICALHNVLVVNGICTTPQESDFAERFLLLELKKISGDALLTDEEFWEEFEKALPYILGAIFDTLSRAIVIRKSMKKPARQHRMAQAYIEMLAIAEALGIPVEKFDEIFWNNIKTMNVLRGDSPVVEAVKEFMNRPGAKKTESGTSSEMYAKIRQNYSGDKNLLPRSPSAFSRKVNLEYDAIRAAGITVSIVVGAQASIVTMSRK